MTIRSKSILAFSDAKTVWDAIYVRYRNNPDEEIIIDEPGRPWTPAQRMDQINRLNRYRTLLRAENASLYPKGHPSHGTTIFDQFAVGMATNAEGHPVIRVYKRTAKGLRVSSGGTEIMVDTLSPLTDSSTSEQGE